MGFEPQDDPVRASAVQRRQLTVLFCDLVGSSALAARLDAEDTHALVVAFLRGCADCIERAGGYVARYMGDGLLAYFGYPSVHEDDAKRAVHAALEIRTFANTLRTPEGNALAVRTGLATGLTVVGEVIGNGPALEHTAIGDTPNLAARLQSVAAPDTVLVSGTTQRLAAAAFEFRNRGYPDLKGVVLREPVWEVLGRKRTPSQFGGDVRSPASPLVGREAELGTLLEVWRSCRAGRRRLVRITGEPGIGKSRLVHEMHKLAGREPYVWLQGGTEQMFRATPFHPIIQAIRGSLGSPPSPESSFQQLRQALAAAGLGDGPAVPLVADLLGIPSPLAMSLALDRDERRRVLIKVLETWLTNLASRWPAILVVEDLHWADPSTTELMETLARGPEASRLMIVVTSRDDRPIAGWEEAMVIRLGRLDRASTRSLVMAVAGEIAEPRLDGIIRRAEGIPLFAEEIARLVAHVDGPADGRIPDTLSDLLLARIESAGAARGLAEAASIFGGEFRLDVLAAFAGRPVSEVRGRLNELARADLVVDMANAETPTFNFRHALLREAAYSALLRDRRRDLHARAAQVICSDFPSLADSQPEVVAQHWERAEAWEPATLTWAAAARRAETRRAFREAQFAFDHAVAVLANLPASPERDDRELELQSARAAVLQITLGYSAPETAAAAAAARTLAERRGNLEKQISNMAAAWMAASSAGDYGSGLALAEQLLPLARADGSSPHLALAYMALLTTRYRMGDMIGAEEAFARGELHFAGGDFRGRPGAAPQTFGNGAITALLRGEPDEARRRMARGLAICEENNSPYDRAFGAFMAATLAVLMSEPDAAAALAREALALSEEHNFPQFAATARIVLARALAASGADESIALAEAGLVAMAQTRSRAGITMYLTWLAEARAMQGRYDAALRTAEEALAANPHELFYRPAALQLRAELREQAGDPRGSQEDLEQAMRLAGASGAGLLYERAASALARLA